MRLLRHEQIHSFDKHCCFFTWLHFPIGCYYCRAIWILTQFPAQVSLSFSLLNMCIDAPDPTTKDLSIWFR